MVCRRTRLSDGSPMWICGDLEDELVCKCCGFLADKLCDYPIGNDKTCDGALCDKCAVKIRGDIDYCPDHAKQWGEVYSLSYCERDGSGI